MVIIVPIWRVAIGSTITVSSISSSIRAIARSVTTMARFVHPISGTISFSILISVAITAIIPSVAWIAVGSIIVASVATIAVVVAVAGSMAVTAVVACGNVSGWSVNVMTASVATVARNVVGVITCQELLTPPCSRAAGLVEGFPPRTLEEPGAVVRVRVVVEQSGAVE